MCVSGTTPVLGHSVNKTRPQEACVLEMNFPDINTISFITQATWMVCIPVPYHLFIGTDGLILPHKGDFQRLSKDPHLYLKKGLPGILWQSSCYELELSLWGPWFCPWSGDLRSHKLWGAAKTKTKTKTTLKTRRGSSCRNFSYWGKW